MIVEIKFDAEELHFLRDFIGSTWESIASPSFNSDGSLALMDVILKSDTQVVTLTADDWQPLGTEGAYSRLSISPSSELYKSAEKAGGLYFQYRGEPVEDVMIVVDTVNAINPGAHPFSLRVDQGVIIKFPSGYLSLVKGGVAGLDINISRAEMLQDLKMYDASFEWSSTLERQYDVQRSIVGVREIEGWGPRD
jgi:hypothetical protein